MVTIKKYVLLLSVLFLIFSSLVTAAVNADDNSLIIDIDYENLRDNDDELTIQHQFTVTNSEPARILDVTSSFHSDYTLRVTPPTITGETSTITISGKVPVNVDQGISDIGKVTIDGQDFVIKTDVREMLEVRKIYVDINGREEKAVNKDGEEVKDIQPGDEIRLRFQLENHFDEDYDEGDIDGSVRIELDDSSFDDDVDEEEDFDLEAGKRIDSRDEEIELSFTVPLTADESTYDLKITVKGDDGNNAKYETKWNLRLKVERDNDDVRIGDFSTTPLQVSCSRNAQVTVEVINFGNDRQKHAAVQIANVELGIDEKVEFELNKGTHEDNSVIKTFNINLDGVKAGTYPIEALSFYDVNKYSHRKLTQIVVKECIEEPEDKLVEDEPKEEIKEDEQQQEKVVEPDVKDQKELTLQRTIASSEIIKTIEDPYTVGDYTLAVILIAIVFLLALIIIFFIILLK